MTVTNVDAFVNESVHEILAGNEENVRSRLKKEVDPSLIRGAIERAKDLGREALKKGQFTEAIDHFSGALALENESPLARAKLFGNRSLVYARMNRIDDSLDEARKAIASDPRWHKGWYRAAKAHQVKGNHEIALVVFRRALELTEKDDKLSIRDLQQAIAEEEAEVRSMKYRSRYSNDYTRFESLAKQLTAEELVEQAAKEQAGEPSIEFAADLDEDQKRALMMQLTGKTGDEELPADLDVWKQNTHFVNLSWPRKLKVAKNSLDGMSSFLRLQRSSTWATRVTELDDLGLPKAYVSELLSATKFLNLQDPHDSIVIFGTDSVSVPLQIVTHSSDQTTVNLLTLTGAPPPLALLSARLRRKNLSRPERVQLFTPNALSEFTRPSSPTRPADEETRLAEIGDAALAMITPKLIRCPGLLVLDAELLYDWISLPQAVSASLFSFEPMRMFPSRISMWAVPVALPLEGFWATGATRRSMLWSLSPQELPRDTYRHARPIDGVAPLRLWSVTKNGVDGSEKSQSEVFDTTQCTAVIFYCTVSTTHTKTSETETDTETETSETETETADCSAVCSMLKKYFVWLTPQKESTRGSLSLLLDNARVVACRLLDETTGEITKRSDVMAWSWADRQNWKHSYLQSIAISEQMETGTSKHTETGTSETQTTRHLDNVTVWRQALSLLRRDQRDRVRRRQNRLKELTLLTDTATTPETAQRHEIRALFLDADDAMSAVDGLKAWIATETETPNTETETADVKTETERGGVFEFRALMMAASVRGLNEHVKDSSHLLEFARLLGIKPKVAAKGLDWHRGDGREEETREEREAAERSSVIQQVREVLFRGNGAHVCLESGDIHRLRWLPENDDMEKRLALASLLRVPPDTPGLDNFEGTLRPVKLFDLMVMSSPSMWPANGLASGMLRTCMYARAVCLESHATVAPSKVKIRACVVGVAADTVAGSTRFVRKDGKPQRQDLEWHKVKEGKVLSEEATLMVVNFNGVTISHHPSRPLTTQSLYSLYKPKPKPVGNMKETAGDMKETAGDMKETAGDMKETAGDMKETAGDRFSLEVCLQSSFTDILVHLTESPSYLRTDPHLLIDSEEAMVIQGEWVDRHDQLLISLAQQMCSSPNFAVHGAKAIIGVHDSQDADVPPISQDINTHLYAMMA